MLCTLRSFLPSAALPVAFPAFLHGTMARSLLAGLLLAALCAGSASAQEWSAKCTAAKQVRLAGSTCGQAVSSTCGQGVAISKWGHCRQSGCWPDLCTCLPEPASRLPDGDWRGLFQQRTALPPPPLQTPCRRPRGGLPAPRCHAHRCRLWRAMARPCFPCGPPRTAALPTSWRSRVRGSEVEWARGMGCVCGWQTWAAPSPRPPPVAHPCAPC